MINDLLKSIPVINFDGQVQITVSADDFELEKQLLSTWKISDATESDASTTPVKVGRWKAGRDRRLRTPHRNKVFTPYKLRTL